MAFEEHPKTGLPKKIDQNDTSWGQKYLDGNAKLEARLGKTTTNDPNGAVAGEWYGQTCWSTAQGVLYECIRPGPATGANAAQWQTASGVAPGTIAEFWRTSVPAGWLPFTGGVYTKVNYPNLYAVLPAGVTKTLTSFTLPNLRGGVMFRRYPDGSEPTFDEVGEVSGSIPLVIGATSTAFNYRIMNVLMGIKF